MAPRYNDKRKGPYIEPPYKTTDFRNVVDIGPIDDYIKTEDLKAGLELECGIVLDVQFWTTNSTRLQHAFITFASSDGATAAFKNYDPPSWWSARQRARVTRFNYPQDLKNYKPVFQSRSDQEKLPSGPSLRTLATSTRHSTSTSPSTAPVDTPVSTYSHGEPSYALSYVKDRIPSSQRETRPTIAPTEKEHSPDSKIALGEARRDKPSRGEEHNQLGCIRESHPSAKLATPFQESGKAREGVWGSSSLQSSSDGQADAMGGPIGISPGGPSGQMSNGKGEGQRAIRAPVNDVPSLKAKVAETKVWIEELTATRETLDEELNELTSKKKKLQEEIARHVKMKTERSRSSLRTAQARPSRSRTALAPSERSTPILSALFLLHSIVTSDTPP